MALASQINMMDCFAYSSCTEPTMKPPIYTPMPAYSNVEVADYGRGGSILIDDEVVEQHDATEEPRAADSGQEHC